MSSYRYMKTVVFTEKTDEFGIAIATIYGLFVFFKSSPGNK